MIDFSPKGMLEAVAVFPFMLMIALALDVTGFIVILFGLDDGGILDIIGFGIFGLWLFFRTGEAQQVSAPSLKEKKAAMKKGVSLLKKFKKVGVRAGLVGLLEFVPVLGSILFGWTGLVIFEFLSDLRQAGQTNMEPEVQG